LVRQARQSGTFSCVFCNFHFCARFCGELVGARKDTRHSNFRYLWFRARSQSLPSLDAFGGMVLVRQARQRETFSYVFCNFHFFLLRHGASSLAAVKASFWNPAISGKVSRSAEFGCNQAYGDCTAGAPKRVEQGFGCTKSALLLFLFCTG
jgi:hypothetical protein